jgi:hypothetical protein
MKMAKLLQKASQVLATAAVAGCLGTPVLANAQYAVGDSQLSAAVGKAITGDAKLQSLNISATVAQGIVTLTGTVPNEADRVEAEQVAAGVDGVRSIQDNLALPAGASDQPPAAANANGADVNQANSQMAPPPPDDAQDNQTADNQTQNGAMPPPPPAQPGTAASGMPPAPPSDTGESADNGAPQGRYNQQTPPPGPGYAENYPDAGGTQGGAYDQPGGWGQRGNAHVPANYNTLAVNPAQQDASGPVTIVPGTLLSVRTDQPLSTGQLKKGDVFQATSAVDLYENGVVAIPRGAIFNGHVVESKNAGPLAGRPKLDLQLDSIQLGGQTYPIASQVWSSEGASKTGYTAANTAGGALFGALIGAVAGGGVGAGVGAVAGGAGGAALSGATHGPRLDLPPEALLQFRLAQPLTVQPVHFAEAVRLANSVPQQPTLRRRLEYAPYPQPYPYPPVPPPYPY